MENTNLTLEQLLKTNKLLDSKNYQVDSEYKSNLKAQLYEQYINSKNQNIMSKIKSIFMNKISLSVIGVTLLALVLVLSYIVFLSPDNKLRSTKIKAVVALASGETKFKRDNQSEWSTLNTGDLVEQGYSVQTAESSKIVLEFDNGDAVRLDANTEIMYMDASSENIVISLVSGDIYNRVSKSEGNHFTVVAGEVKGVALGTAFLFKYEPNVVAKIFTYESSVSMEYKDLKNKIDALNKGEINFEEEKKEIEVKTLEESEIKTEFVAWNKSEDEKTGRETWEGNKPNLLIFSPADGFSTTESTIELTGKVSDDSALKKIIVNGAIYMNLDAQGYGFNPETGDFKVLVTLSEGQNKIEVKAYDVYWNASDTLTTSVTKTTPVVVTVAPTSKPTQEFYISSISSPAAGKIYVKWYVKGYDTPNGFKIVKSTDANPVYPGNDYNYQSNSATRELTWTGLSAGTYHVRVCIYNGSGTCTKYSNDKTVTVGAAVTNTPADASITGLTAAFYSPDKVKLSWTVNGTWNDGFKVVWSQSANPTYPGLMDDYHYHSNSGTRNDIVYTSEGLVSGNTYHFRVCLYNGSCASTDYSPDKSITIP